MAGINITPETFLVTYRTRGGTELNETLMATSHGNARLKVLSDKAFDTEVVLSTQEFK